jgi:FAD/FMN-containing dehydrogenase
VGVPVDFEPAERFIHTNARLLDRHQSAAPRRLYKRGESGYDARRSGFNVAIEHHPALVVEAFSLADVIAAVRLAAADCRPVAVMNTGHGPSLPADGAVLIRMGQINRVDVDPIRRRARIEGGASWRAVIDAAAPYGLAPLNGSSPDVGAVGYTLGATCAGSTWLPRMDGSGR